MTILARPSSQVLATFALVLACLPGCYEGIEGDGLDEFGSEQGESGTDAGESGDAGDAGDAADSSTSDTDPSTTDPSTTDPTDPSTTDPSTSDTDPSTTDPSTTDPSTSDTDPSTTTDSTTGDTGGGDLPGNSYCNPVQDWDAQWVAYELEVIELVNEARAQGGNCGAYGNKPPSGPLTWEPHLTCAARVHSLDMAMKDYFDHTNLEGHDPGWRLDQAGYAGGGWGENIAAGYPTPAEAVQGWLDSDGHCNNMLNGDFTTTGVGYAYDNGSSYGAYWTQTFGN